MVKFKLISFLKIALLLSLSCATTERVIETVPEPPKVDPVIEQVKASPELAKKPVLQNQIKVALEDCKKYGEDILSKFNGCIDTQNKQASLIAKYKADVVKLEEEVWQWRKIKYTAYAIVAMAVLVLIGRLLWPVIMGVLRKGAGLP